MTRWSSGLMSHPSISVLYLDSGVVDGNLNLKQFSAIGGPNAENIFLMW